MALFHRAKRVSFVCTKCGSDLESPLEEAGQTFPCPTCGHKLVVPGIEELNRIKAEKARKEEAEAEAARKLTELERQTAKAIATPEARPVDYERLAVSAEAAGLGRSSAYPDIISGASWLKGIGSVVGVLGFVCLGLAALLFFAGLASLPASAGGMQSITVVAPSISLAISGIAMVAAAAVIKMFGATAMAIRDIAMNTK